MQNTIILNKRKYRTECFWRSKKASTERDSKGELFPYPIEQKNPWVDMNNFVFRLTIINRFMDDKHKYEKYDEPKDCLLCEQRKITTRRYIFDDLMWEDGLLHYVEVHNIEPSLNFKRFVFSNLLNEDTQKQKSSDKNSLRLKRIQKFNKQYVMLERNQLLILDALMIHGGYSKRYVDELSQRYSEHAGLLDFEGDRLERIIVSGRTQRVDIGDDEIFLPTDMDDMFDYEYIFHTHPPTPKPGGRAKGGVLYEFPSIGDIYHFIDHHNDGNVIGSLIVTAEGLYNIRVHGNNNKKITIDDDDLYKQYQVAFGKIQREAIQKYGTNFNTHTFYSKIAQNIKYINEMNNILNKFNINIDFYPRKKDKKGKWYLDTIFLVFKDK
jgi:hypothetical protein